MDAPEIISGYLELARLDPAYRDLYRLRACEMLAPLVSRAAYAELRRSEGQLTRQKQTLERAVERHEWERVASLAASVRVTETRLNASATDLALARDAYDAADVPIGPLSVAAARLTQGGASRFQAARVRVLTLLTQTSEGDPAWADHLVARRAELEALADPASSPLPNVLDERQLEDSARRALERGQWETLERLAKAVHPEVAEAVEGCACGAGDALPMPLAPPVGAPAIASAKFLGLVPVNVEGAGSLRAFMTCRCAAFPTLGSERSTAGATGTHHCACHERCPDIEGALRENLDLLKHRLFVTSCGERYVPAFQAETVLLECFSEDANSIESSSPLLTALGLVGRCGLNRWELEDALTERGPDLLRRLGLDPWEYRLVCVPFDVYQRVAGRYGWGQRPLWTHFDGYQVWRGWNLRALVGGHASFGGQDDLSGIGFTDARDNTVVRLAIVSRSRLLADVSSGDRRDG